MEYVSVVFVLLYFGCYVVLCVKKIKKKKIVDNKKKKKNTYEAATDAIRFTPVTMQCDTISIRHNAISMRWKNLIDLLGYFK